MSWGIHAGSLCMLPVVHAKCTCKKAARMRAAAGAVLGPALAGLSSCAHYLPGANLVVQIWLE